MKTPIEAEQIRRAALRGVYVPSPTASKPVEPPKPPADAEQVERVARAIFQEAKTHEDDMPTKLQAYTESADDFLSRKCRHLARAAIAAMGGGRRWGVRDIELRAWVGEGRADIFVTHEKTAAEWLVRQCESWHERGFEVREYVEQAKVKTADQLAAEEVVIKHHCQHVPGLAEAITAAIENARKGAGDAK
jgi:hypothetical protein